MKVILTVDESPEILEVLKYICQDENFTVLPLRDYRELKDAMIIYQPDIILINPYLNYGNDIVNLLSKIRVDFQIPIILLTTSVSEIIPQKLYGDDVIYMPFEIDDLVQCVTYWLNKSDE